MALLVQKSLRIFFYQNLFPAFLRRKKGTLNFLFVAASLKRVSHVTHFYIDTVTMRDPHGQYVDGRSL